MVRDIVCYILSIGPSLVGRVPKVKEQMAVIQKSAMAVEVILLVKATKPVKVVIMAMLARTEAVVPDDM